MSKRLFPLLALLLLVLTGCAGKTTGTNATPPEDYTLTLPAGWRSLPLDNMPTGTGQGLVEVGLRPLGVYTNAPGSQLRLPFLVFTRNDGDKPSRSDMLLVRDNIEALFGMQAREEGSSLKVTDKFFDEEAHRLIAEVALANEDNIRLNALITFYFSEKGMIVAFGYTDPGDSEAMGEIRAIMESAVLSPELQYRPIVTK
jgi:hypothetical protein